MSGIEQLELRTGKLARAIERQLSWLVELLKFCTANLKEVLCQASTSQLNKLAIFSILILSGSALASNPPPTQTIITLVNNGNASEIILPINSKIVIKAMQINPSEDGSELHAIGQVAIAVAI